MIFPVDFVSQIVSRVPVSPGDLELDALFEDHGILAGVDVMFALEWATYRRRFPAQIFLSALQMYSRERCAHLLRDLAATVVLPRHNALFPVASGPCSQVVRK